MKYICVTEVDTVTKIPCTEAAQKTGPSMPEVKGFISHWQNMSIWPVKIASNGIYLTTPKYYGTCDDDGDITLVGVLQVMTEEEYNALRVVEHEARRPYPSWIGYLDFMSWAAPIARPANAIMNGGNVAYKWDEAVGNWVPME